MLEYRCSSHGGHRKTRKGRGNPRTLFKERPLRDFTSSTRFHLLKFPHQRAPPDGTKPLTSEPVGHFILSLCCLQTIRVVYGRNLFLCGALWCPDTQASSFSVVPLTEGRPSSFCVPSCHVQAALNTHWSLCGHTLLFRLHE